MKKYMILCLILLSCLCSCDSVVEPYYPYDISNAYSMYYSPYDLDSEYFPITVYAKIEDGKTEYKEICTITSENNSYDNGVEVYLAEKDENDEDYEYIFKYVAANDEVLITSPYSDKYLFSSYYNYECDFSESSRNIYSFISSSSISYPITVYMKPYGEDDSTYENIGNITGERVALTTDYFDNGLYTLKFVSTDGQIIYKDKENWDFSIYSDDLE